MIKFKCFSCDGHCELYVKVKDMDSMHPDRCPISGASAVWVKRPIKLTINSLCPHCGTGLLELCKGNEPYSIDNLICSKCDSTYILEDEE